MKAFKENDEKNLLRFITCGSVDDGKSTLIGRLLYDDGAILEGSLKSMLDKDGNIDFASLLDGLESEAEQGITIDVAYRFFETKRRKYIVADTPGHEQYTRNMATGASTADAAVILIDARKGVLAQTKRHTFIVSLLGIRHIVVAVNKMDLVGFEQKVFEEIKADFRRFAPKLPNYEQNKFEFIPICALLGDNVVKKSVNTPWYKGEALLDFLDELDASREKDKEFRFPVQFVNRPNSFFRGYAGGIASGQISEGDEIVALPSGKKTRVKAIISVSELGEKDLNEVSMATGDSNLNYISNLKTVRSARVGDAVTLCLKDEIDVSRGDVFVLSRETSPVIANSLLADIVWMNETPLNLEGQYIVRLGAAQSYAKFEKIHYKYDINELRKLDADTLRLNDVARCQISLEKAICAEAYAKNRVMGAFIVIDKYSGETLGAGMISEANANEDKIERREYTASQKALNRYVREFFPEWGCREI